MTWCAVRPFARFFALSLLLAGCATPPREPGNAFPGKSESTAVRTYSEHISLGGRLSLQYQRGSSQEAVHGSFTWSQTPERTSVTLLSPIGQTLAVIDITPTVSTLTQAGQAPRVAADADLLAAETLGWPLPVAGLRDWLQGFAVDAAGRRFVAMPQGTPTKVITRDGWNLTYVSWQDDHDASRANHPKRIDLERSTAQAGDVSIRIVIDGWQPR